MNQSKKDCLLSEKARNEPNIDEILVKLQLTNLYTLLKVMDSDSKKPFLVVDIFYYHYTKTPFCKGF